MTSEWIMLLRTVCKSQTHDGTVSFNPEAIEDVLNEVERLQAEKATLKAERDAAVEDIRQSCKTCIHSGKPSCPWEGTYHHKSEDGEKIGVCNAWQWRRVKAKEESENESSL